MYLKNNHFRDVATRYDSDLFIVDIRRITGFVAEVVALDVSYNLNRLTIYRNTVVVHIVENRKSGMCAAKLRNNGWYTSTTKKHINKALAAYGVKVFQRDFEWYVEAPCFTKTLKYTEGMAILLS